MAKRVLFLDIDGVLNHDRTKERCNRYRGVDRELAKRLTDFIGNTDIEIVLSSTWRNHPEMHDHLKEAGINWVDITPDLSKRGRTSVWTGATRGAEINAWLSEHPEIETYAILDDDPSMLPDQKPRFVQTYMTHGVQDEHIEQLKALFGITE